MRTTTNYIFIVLSLLLMCSLVSADDEYCAPPPTDIFVVLDHTGDWWNFTLTSDACYTCMDNGGGYGDLDCVPCTKGASFTANKTCGIVPFAVRFNDTSTGGAISDYYWDFVGNISLDQNPVMNYTVPGVYGVDHSSTIDGDVYWSNETGYITARAIGDTCDSTSGYVVGSGGVSRDSDSVWLVFGGIGGLVLVLLFVGFMYIKR
jgi:hypothetical protein